MSATAGSLKKRVLESGSWTTLGYGAQMGLKFVSTLILSRLLAPEIFGVMAIALVVQMMVSLLSDVGIFQAVIQSKRGSSERMLQTAWTVQILQGILVWLVCVMVAAALHSIGGGGWLSADSVYAAPELPLVVVLLSLTSVIAGFESTNLIVAHRDLNLKRVMMVNVGAQIVGLIATAFLAWQLRSIWALIGGGLLASTALMLGTHYFLPGTRMRLRWDWESIHELRGFGGWVLLSSGVWVIAINVDRLMLGGWIDPATLGMYSLAFTVAKMLADGGETLIQNVAMPAMSEKFREDPKGLSKLYFSVRMPFDALFLIGSGFLFSAAHLIVGILFDDRYAGAGRMLQALALTLVFTRYAMAFNAYLALGKPRYCFYVNLARLVSIVTIVPAAFFNFGFDAALWAIGLHMAPVVPLIFWLNREFGLNNFRFEALVLLAWPIGYYIGKLGTLVMSFA